ncbi:MAG: hypothetical protein IJ493_00080 [Clostridia bacterium]|nr:hypothetical protein [Clostridia bacterium]
MLTQTDTARIERLRDAAVSPTICPDAFHLRFWRSWAANPDLSDRERYATAYTAAFADLPVTIDDGELIVGKVSVPLTAEEQREWENLRAAVAQPRIAMVGQDSHMAIDYDKLLTKGLSGVIAEIDGYLCGETDAEKRAFYQCSRACLEAVSAYSNRYADRADALADTCADAVRAGELREIARICRRVPMQPAATFHEAVQAVHFISHCLTLDPFRYFASQQFQLGRPDRYLYPFYQRDKAAGILTDEGVQCLLDCLAIQVNNRVPHGLSCGWMVGGRDAEGVTVANELTEMGMQVIDDVRLVYPAVGLCWTPDMPERFLRKACEILSHGRSHPAIFNDDLIAEGLQLYGVPAADSRMYIHSTCVEITPIGASNVWVASPYTNMPGLLLDLLDGDYPTFEALLDAYFARLSAHIRNNFEEKNANRAQRFERGMEPLLSCFVDDCLANGRDLEQGGARYNWIMPSFVGVANLVDSLEAIRTMVYEKQALTLPELKAMLDANFEGYDAMRTCLSERCAKYGNDDDRVDSLFGLIVDFIVAECKKYTPMLSGARLIPSVFCWIMHEYFGRETGATPDGRLAGFPLGDCSGPCQGRERKGPTASVLSSTKWSHRELIGGVAVNMKFSKKTMTADSCAKIASVVRTFMKRGGFEMQINVTDRETLLAARENPDAYRDLVVRIGGYSDYFVKISSEMQAEVLLRTEHEI